MSVLRSLLNVPSDLEPSAAQPREAPTSLPRFSGGMSPSLTLRSLSLKRKYNRTAAEGRLTPGVASTPSTSEPLTVSTSAPAITAASAKPNGIVRRGGKQDRPKGLFLLTVLLGDITSGVARKFQSDFVTFISELVSEYVVSIEQGNTVKSAFHLHTFLRFKEEITCVEFREKCVEFFKDCVLDIQTVKNVRGAIKYVSKEDTQCLYNINISRMSFAFQAYYYCSSMESFDMGHSFVRNHPQYYKYLRELFLKLKLKRLCRNHYISPLVMFDYDWCREVYAWYYNFVSTKYYHKKKHIYLYGPSNVGKSYFARHLVSHLGGYVYYPSRQYPFGSLDVYHKVIVWDEFSFDQINHDYLKLVLSGETFPINEKYVPERNFNVTIPIIMLSNHDPLNDDWFLNRCQVVQCLSSLQEDLEDIVIEDIDGFIGEDIED